MGAAWPTSALATVGRRLGVTTLGCVLVLGACSPTTSVVEPDTTAPATAAPATTRPATVEVAPCVTGTAPFRATGSIGATGRSATDARTLRQISWDVYERCERLSLTFAAAEGAPAVVAPQATASLDRTNGIVRLRLPADVDTSVIATHVVETRLVDEIYVVRDRDGTLSVDVHLGGPAEARLLAGSGPASLWIDLVPGGEPYEAAPIRSGGVVLVTPTGGTVAYPLSVVGYARSADPIAVRLTSAGTDVESTAEPAGDGSEWGSFDAIFPSGPTGPTTLTAGPVGVVIDVEP